MRVLFSDDIPDPRDIAMIALANACGVFRTILTSEERAQVRDRIDLLKNLDLIGRTMSLAIEGLGTPDDLPPKPRRPKEIPVVPGLPLLGNGLAMRKGLVTFLARQYRELGPIFRTRSGAPVRVHRGAGVRARAMDFFERRGAPWRHRAVLVLVTGIILYRMESWAIDYYAGPFPPPRLLALYGLFFGFGWMLLRRRETLEGFRRPAWVFLAAGTLCFFVYRHSLEIGCTLVSERTCTGVGGGSGGEHHLWAVIFLALSMWFMAYGLIGLFLRYMDGPSRRSSTRLSSVPPLRTSWASTLNGWPSIARASERQAWGSVCGGRCSEGPLHWRRTARRYSRPHRARTHSS